MEVSEISYRIIADLLSVQTGQQLTESRRWRIGTALAGVFRERGITNIDQLVCMLSMPGEAVLKQEVVEALLNNETYFFRDKPTFDQLPNEILPLLAEKRASRKRLKIWSAGCSTGQEVHSLSMLFAEQAGQWEGWTIDILGTDVSSQAIDGARRGCYSQFEIQRGLSVAQMLRHFEETPSGWQLLPDFHSNTRFIRHNILDEPPSSKPFDLILCRNVLLYFDPATRARAFGRLQEALAPDGVLMLGAGETVVGQTDLFAPMPGRASLYEPHQGKQAVYASLSIAR